jgi:hypothetical protein
VATLHGGELRFGDSHPGLIATLAIPALAGTAFSSEVDTGSREENTSKQRAGARA